MYEQVLFKNRKPDRPATIDEYRESGGYEVLVKALKDRTPEEVCKLVLDSGLRGRGGAGFPTGKKWSFVPKDASPPRYLVPNTDEMEPGTFKDRMLVNIDPHLVIEGIILAGFAVQAQTGFFFIRPSYEMDAELIEREAEVARQAGFLGKNIQGSDFSFDLVVHRSAGRYICGEATAQVSAIQGDRVRPLKERHMAADGLWHRPTIVNNAETLANVPGILRNGADWFKGLARTKTGAGTRLFCVSGKVRKPGCYELPSGIPLREVIEESAGGLSEGSELKAFMPGGASTHLMPPKYFDAEMDFESFKKTGQRLGTSAIMIFDQNTCLVAAALNLTEYFARESCGYCTPCREGLPYLRDLLWRIENGEGREEFIPLIEEQARYMDYSYCAFAPGAAEPILGLLKYFKDEVLEHISQKKCPISKEYRPYRQLWYPPE